MKINSVRGFSGVDENADFSNDLQKAVRMRNFRITGSGSMVKRQGVKKLLTCTQPITGIWSGRIGNSDLLVYCAGGRLYTLSPDGYDNNPVMIGVIGDNEKCLMFDFNGRLYIKTDSAYKKYDGSTLSDVVGYVPLMAISCDPDGGGTPYEQINLLSDKRRQLFSSDGSRLQYTLAEKDIETVNSIYINGEICTINYTLDRAEGKISFQHSPQAGLNNVEITYSKSTDEESRQRFFGCTQMMKFGGNSDGRIFLWGNTLFPNYRFHSDLADGIPSAEYFPVNAFTIIGNSKINCIVQQYDKQLIFTENEAYYSYCELCDDGTGAIYSSFPVFSLNNGKGCIFETAGCVIDNTPVTLCSDGLNRWESTSLPNEKNAVCFSRPIEKSMRSIIGENAYPMYLFDFQANREMFFVYSAVAYIYNYGNGTWYCYNNFDGKNFCVSGNLLYYSMGNNLFAFGNDLNFPLSDTCIWESGFITGGGASGKCDLTRLEADMHIKGQDSLCFKFEKAGVIFPKLQWLSFPEGTDRFFRIALRPSIKRAMPLKIRFYDEGPGECTLHGLTITTREKERSGRDGIL